MNTAEEVSWTAPSSLIGLVDLAAEVHSRRGFPEIAAASVVPHFSPEQWLSHSSIVCWRAIPEHKLPSILAPLAAQTVCERNQKLTRRFARRGDIFYRQGATFRGFLLRPFLSVSSFSSSHHERGDIADSCLIETPDHRQDRDRPLHAVQIR